MNSYRLENETFIIENYDKKVPFCSFLPGLTGEKGVPIWSFYVNRGQCLTSFGVGEKDRPIMEFSPANVAYENTAIKGFRTFIRKNGKFFEPFGVGRPRDTKRTIFIKQNSFRIEEIDNENQFKTTVTYYILPNESFGALVRDVNFENLGDNAEFEILDGIPRVIPYGVTGEAFSRMAFLMSSYNNISNLENKIPLIFNKISGDDDSEIKFNEGGHFYLTFDKNGLICPVYDPKAVYCEDTSLSYPINFAKCGLESVLSYKQNYTNKICGCYTPAKICLKSGEEYRISSLCGYTHSAEFINEKAKDIDFNYIDKKLVEADELSNEFTRDVKTKSGQPVMDMYFKQCYLDNFLRGGYPFVFESDDKNKVVHLFSRKHGDPERDYNNFSIAAEYYSQGNGNFRDVLQNRRNDVLFHPNVNDFNIEMFFSYIQFDGYNPLQVKGTTFEIVDKEKANAIINECVNSKREVVEKIISESFTAGSLINGIYNNNVELNISDDEFLRKILSVSIQNFEASTDKFGNWSDHWDYLLDLVDNYLKVFPDKKKELLFDNCSYKYFDSDLFIQPRSKKYCFDGKEARQLNAYVIDKEKYSRGYKLNDTNWLKTVNGETYKTNLFEKLLSLCVNKFALLDSSQMGIEMEADRAGWCDACNGLPSMFGSGMSETFELIKMLKFTLGVVKEFADKTVKIPEELIEFLKSVTTALNNFKSEFTYWDEVATAREAFREKTRYNITGKTVDITIGNLADTLEKFIALCEKGVEKAIKLGNGFCPTYFKYKADEFEIVNENADGYPNIKVKKFSPVMITKWLEGPAKQIRECFDPQKASEILEKVKNSNVYDKKLKMFKTSENISSEGLSFGRVAAFTPGWQENESVFLHMEYKFLFGILKSGNYKAFYKELKNVFIPFLNPETYGRSTLENCSFLVSSSNPDENLHGRGFVSRLSGSTTEVISIWSEMFIGSSPFVFENGKLGLYIKPLLADFMFDENGEVTFNFLTTNKVTVHNPTKQSVYDKTVKYYIIDGVRFEGEKVFDAIVEKVREERNSKIDIYY